MSARMFTLDICKGKSREQLCRDYRRTSRAAGHWQSIALCLAAKSPSAVKKLPEEYRADLERLIQAYKD